MKNKRSKKEVTRIVRESLCLTSLLDVVVGLVLVFGCVGSYDTGRVTTVTKVLLVVAILLFAFAFGIYVLLDRTSYERIHQNEKD